MSEPAAQASTASGVCTRPAQTARSVSSREMHDNFVGKQDRLAGLAGQAGIVWL